MLVVVGIRSELRDTDEICPDEEHEDQWQYITIEEGIQLANTVGASFYIECSYINGNGIMTLFEELALLLCWQDGWLPDKSGKKGKEHIMQKGEGDHRCLVQRQLPCTIM